MLTQVFSHQFDDWHGIPRNTIANGVERINQDSKQENPTSLHGTSDKAKALAAEKQSSMTYRSQTEESRHKSATSRKHQRGKQMAMDSDQDAQLGPSDKRSKFNNSRKCRSDLDLESDLDPLVRKGKGKSS